MPITIGNTTISGLAVDGLPAGSILANNIAVDAVTLSKLYEDCLLQFAHDQKSSLVSGSNSFAYQTTTLSSTTGSKFLEVTITPLSITSLIWVSVYISTLSETSDHSNNIGHGIWKNNTGAPVNIGYISPRGNIEYPLQGVNHIHELTMEYGEISGSLAARTFSWYAGCDSGAACINGIGNNNSWSGQGISIMTVMEINKL
jgi:hypothetical protein